MYSDHPHPDGRHFMLKSIENKWLFKGFALQKDYPCYLENMTNLTSECINKDYLDQVPLVPDSRLLNYFYLPANNNSQVILAMAYSPVSVIIYACDYFAMKNYGMGVYKMPPKKCKDDATDYVHAVTIVGYGRTNRGADYWSIKNSYSADWGKNGFFRLARNVPWDRFGGQNGVLTKPIYVVPDNGESNDP